jgi:hypothetical protein
MVNILYFHRGAVYFKGISAGEAFVLPLSDSAFFCGDGGMHLSLPVEMKGEAQALPQKSAT